MAKRIPEDFVVALRSRIDIAELVGGYVSLKKQGRNLVGLCPFHNEKTPSFIVSPDRQTFKCFGCGKGGNAFTFLMEIEGLSFPDAVARAASMVGLELPQEDMSPEEAAAIQKRRRYFKLLEEASALYRRSLGQKNAAPAQDYLRRRGVSPELAARFALGYADGWDGAVRQLLERGYELPELEEAGLAGRSTSSSGFFDKFHHRLIFPILDYRGQTVAFGGRILEEGQPKYLNSPETRYFHKSQNLYGLYQAAAAIRHNDEAVLMEGYMDVISAHQFGVNNAVASLGTAFNGEHARLLRRYTTRVLLSYDGDGAGLAAADKAADILHGAGFAVRLLTIPKGLDPDEYLKQFGKPGWDRLVQETAADFWQHRLNKALREHKPDSVAGKVAVMQQLKPYLNACEDAIELESVINLLAKAIGVAPQTVYGELKPRANVAALRAKPKIQSRPDRSQSQPINRIQANLLLFMLYDKGIFERVLAELGENFVDSSVLQELLTWVQNNKEKYDWQPATIFSYFPEGEVYSLLLKMVQADFDKEQLPALAEGCIRAIKIERLQARVREIREKLAVQGSSPGEAAAMLKEIAELERQIHTLRSGDNKL